MKLGPFFETITPFLEGRIDHARVSEALWPADPARGGVDGERLAIYGRFCHGHRLSVLGIFSETRAALVARGGEDAWERLVEGYFAAHPMRHFELNENGAAFPDWLAGETEARGLPPWLASVADAEWWVWRVEYEADPEGASGAGEGPLRIAPHVELRPYAYDVAGWLEGEPAERASEPEPRETLCLFWRDRDLDGRFAIARPVELALLKALSEGMPIEELAGATGVPLAALLATASDLRDAGILDGR